MTTQEFTITLDRQPTDDEIDALYEAGFDDSMPEYGNGHGLIHVMREADTLADAILSAVADAAKAGFEVVSIQDEDAVTLKDIAQRLGRTYESIRLYATGKRGPGGFPPAQGSGGYAFYSWTAVADWITANTKMTAAVSDRARTLTAADYLLRAKALHADLAPLSSLLVA